MTWWCARCGVEIVTTDDTLAELFVHSVEHMLMGVAG